MAKNTEKKKRGRNFTEYERGLLVDLVKTHGDVIECKKKDVKTTDKKKKAWEEILIEFNSDVTVSKRDKNQLQNLWKDMKSTAKKDVARHNKERVKTGGGKAPEPTDALTDTIVAFIPGQFSSIQGTPDDDEGMPSTVGEENSTPHAPGTSTQNDIMDPNEGMEDDPGASTAEDHFHNQYVQHVESNPPARSDLSEVNRRAEEYHQLRMELLKQEHKFKLQIFQLELDMKQEGHALRMDILHNMQKKMEEQTVIDLSSVMQ